MAPQADIKIHAEHLAQAVMDCAEALETNQPTGYATIGASQRAGTWAIAPMQPTPCDLYMRHTRKGWEVRVVMGDAVLAQSVGLPPMDGVRTGKRIKVVARG